MRGFIGSLRPRVGRITGIVLALLVIAGFAFVLLQIAAGGPIARTTVGDDPTATFAPTFTVAPTATETAIPTIAPSPTPRPAPPVTTPSPTPGPFFAPEPPGGVEIWAYVINAHCPTSEQIDWQVVIQLYMKPGDTIVWHWVHYDGAALGQPADATFTAYVPTAEYPWTSGPYDTQPDRIGADDTWNITGADMTGSTARWGDQLVIDTINGEPPATPLVTPVHYAATGC